MSLAVSLAEGLLVVGAIVLAYLLCRLGPPHGAGAPEEVGSDPAGRERQACVLELELRQLGVDLERAKALARDEIREVGDPSDGLSELGNLYRGAEGSSPQPASETSGQLGGTISLFGLAGAVLWFFLVGGNDRGSGGRRRGPWEQW